MKKKSDSLPPLPLANIVKPFLFYADVWNRERLDQTRMNAYKEMESENQIQILKVMFSKKDQIVVIEYKSTMPHEWVLDDLKKRVAEKMEQLSLL